MLWIEHVHGKLDVSLRPLFLRGPARQDRAGTDRASSATTDAPPPAVASARPPLSPATSGTSSPSHTSASASASGAAEAGEVLRDEAGAIGQAATRLGVPVPSGSTGESRQGQGQQQPFLHSRPAGVEVRLEASRVRLSMRVGGVKLRGPSLPAMHAASVQLQLDVTMRACAVYQRSGRDRDGQPRGPGNWRLVESDGEEFQIREDTGLSWPEAEGLVGRSGSGVTSASSTPRRGHRQQRAFAFELHALHKRIDAAVSVPSSILRSMIRAVVPRVMRNLIGRALLPEAGEVLCGG